MTTFKNTTTATLTYQALKAVGAQCDGAHSNDAVGFSGYDAGIAHDLLRKGFDYGWSEKQFAYAQKLAHKYRRQATLLGHDVEACKSEPAPVREAKIKTPEIVDVMLGDVKKSTLRATVFERLGGGEVVIGRSLLKQVVQISADRTCVTIPGWLAVKEKLEFAA